MNGTDCDDDRCCKWVEDEPTIPYVLMDSILMIVIILGNVLTICAILFHRKLNTVANQFILSLAAADLLVGITLPYHTAFYITSQLGQIKYACLLRFTLTIFACVGSIYNLISIAVDRFIAIIYSLHYCRYMTKRRARIIIGSGWCFSLFLGTIPLYWNAWPDKNCCVCCELTQIVKEAYITGILTPLYILLLLMMIIIYWKIHNEAKKHIERHRNSNVNRASREGKKSMHVVVLIVGCFAIAWLPFITVMCVQSTKHDDPIGMERLYRVMFYVAISNSCLNPLIYAWKNRDFKYAFLQMLQCKSMNPSHDMDISTAMNGRVSIISLFGSRKSKPHDTTAL